MPEFSYRVLDKEGEIQTGVLDAVDRAAATAELYRAGLTPVDVSADGPTFAMRLNEPVTFFDRPSDRDIQAFLRDLGRLLTAGLSIDDSLRLLQNRQSRDLLAKEIERVRDKVRRGESLAAALSTKKQYFNVQIIAAVQAGELSGTLAEALMTVSTSMDQALSFKERVRSALIYPAILTLMVFATFLLVITFVLPQFAPLFAGNEDRLPWATRFVMGLGDILIAQWYVVAAVFTAVLSFALHIAISKSRRGLFLVRLASLPGMKDWVVTPDLVRFVRTLGVCVQSGVSLDNALAMATDAVKLPTLSEELSAVRAQVRRGRHLSQAFAELSWFSPLVLQFTKVGEQSGRLGQMLSEAAGIVGQDYEHRLEKGLEVLSPVLTLVMGAMVALLVGSVLLGIMSINDVAL